MHPRVARGRLVFRQAGPSVPIHNLVVEARVHRLAPGGWRRCTTDLDGAFAVELDGEGTVELRLIDLDYRYETDGSPSIVERTALEHTVEVSGDDLGEIPVAWWPYRDDTPTPRVAPMGGALPQKYSRGFLHTLELSVARTLPARTLLEGMRLLGEGRPTAAEIQSHQPRVRSMLVDEERPGTSRSDAFLGDHLLNGFDIASGLGRDAEDPSRLRLAIRWGDLPARTDGGGFDLTDVDVVLDASGDEVLPVRIEARIRTPDGSGGFASDRHLVSEPGDASWEAAKRIVRCQVLLQGALDGHIISAHLQTEAAAIAVFRNLRQSPIRRLLHAHLQEIVAQDHDGDSFAWGPRGILVSQSALTPSAVEERMRRVSAGLCWETFAPVPPVHPSHRYALAAGRFWDLLGRYVDDFFAAHRDEIVASWPEIRRLSDDLVRASPPYDPLPRDESILPLRETEVVQRVTLDGVLRSAPPITAADAPAEGDLARLAQWCRVVLFRATFDHTWTHDGQYDAGGDLLLATFGLRAGSVGPEDDAALLPSPSLMIESISTNSIGIHANYGMVLADEERDVPPALKAALEAEREAFAALGVDVARIRSRINI